MIQRKKREDIPKTSLVNVGADVLVLIAVRLNTIDVLSFSLVCWTVRHVLKERHPVLLEIDGNMKRREEEERKRMERWKRQCEVLRGGEEGTAEEILGVKV